MYIANAFASAEPKQPSDTMTRTIATHDGALERYIAQTSKGDVVFLEEKRVQWAGSTGEVFGEQTRRPGTSTTPRVDRGPPECKERVIKGE